MLYCLKILVQTSSTASNTKFSLQNILKPIIIKNKIVLFDLV